MNGLAGRIVEVFVEFVTDDLGELEGTKKT